MKYRKKVLTGAVFTAFLLASPVLSAYAGWNNDSGEWQYLNSDGNAVTDQWKSSGDDWYYLNSAGVMERNSLIQIDDDYYYVDEDGKRMQNQWFSYSQEESVTDNYGYETYWYYFGSNGKAYRKKSNTFKKTINENTYVFDEDGIMLTGFINEDGELLEDEDPFIEARYYCGGDGVMYRGKWLEYDYLDDSELRSAMAEKKYLDYDKLWLYFDSDGKKVASSSEEKLTQRIIDSETYGFDENGVMMTWWSQMATGSNAATGNTSPKFYSGYDGGTLLKESWIWMYPSEELAETATLNKDDYEIEEYSWWRTDPNGRVYKNRIKKIGQNSYAFDEIGRMQTGFVLFDGKSTYVAQWDIDAWEKEDFIDNGSELRLYGLEVADLYLFSPDELNGGVMQTGREIKLELADNRVHTFGFDAGGKAYGSRCQLVKKHDSYYFNGLRLEADKDLKYGVVEVEEGKYKVVNTNGKIMTGKKKLLKDGEDGWYVIINDEFKAYVSSADKPKWYTDASGQEGYYQYNKDMKYGDFIANKDTVPNPDDLPEDAYLFDYSNVVN